MSNSSDGGGFGCAMLIAILVGGVFLAYSVLDNAGLMTHSKAVDVYMKGDWLVGENRVCSGVQMPNDKKTYEMDALFCPSDAPAEQGHNISIRFWGRISRPDAVRAERLLTWQCTRSSDGFTCKALD
jgi:hypothetical protein